MDSSFAGLKVMVDPMWGNGANWFTRLLSGGKTQVLEIHNHRNPIFPEMKRPEPIRPNVDVGLRRTVGLVQAKSALSPMTLGHLKPVILVPLESPSRIAFMLKSTAVSRPTVRLATPKRMSDRTSQPRPSWACARSKGVLRSAAKPVLAAS